ncbi:type III-D CRISPR-associated protein Csx19 [Spongiactinospora gelatinilytica]|uniref:type III-D CRISPR-associated protein Csx19 n=1 Tax=Spongiactinospora gelatinilytica TaxID=2666298 RepID=UPI0013140AFF|nr:CRISPR-associated protein Csx19 [Spongiactinospora gelatinilytica]
MTTSLHAAAVHGITLSSAIAAAGLAGGCALLTAPSAYHVTRVTTRGCTTPDGPVDLSTVYEARIFTEDLELRWMEPGHAVVLTEDAGRLPGSFGEPIEPLCCRSVIDARYLVWGVVHRPGLEWAELRSSRVGVRTIPRSGVRPQERVRLAAREYVVTEPQHGNAYVAEERLIGFEPYSPEGSA